MKFSNSRGFSVVEALLIIVLIGLLGGVGYYVYSQNMTEESPTSSSNTQQEPASNESGTLVTSANKAFSVRIPDGWQIINATDEDAIFSQSSQDGSELNNSNSPATVTNSPAPQGDGLFRFSIRQLKAEDFSVGSWVGEPDSSTSFKQGDIAVKKYVKVYPAGTEGLGANQGQTAYLYVFEKADSVTFVSYNVFKADGTNIKTDDKDQSKLVDEVVKTLTIN